MSDFIEAPETVKAIIYNGRGLKSRKSDVFVAKVIFGIDGDKRKTNVVHDNNPTWNEEGEFKVHKSDKAVFKFKLYDGDETVGVIKIPVNELSEERQVKSLSLEPYKKGQPQPAGELQVSAYVVNYKSIQRRKSSTLGGKIKAKMSNSNLNLKDDAASVVSGESKTSLSSKSKMSTMRKKIFNRKSQDGHLGAQSMMNLATNGQSEFDDNAQSFSLNPFLNDTKDMNDTIVKRPDSKFQTLAGHGSRKNSIVDAHDHVSVNGSEQSSIPGSAASLERKKEKANRGGKGFMKSLKKPFGNSSKKERSKSMWDISNLPVEGWEQKMEHRLSKSPTPGEGEPVEDQGIYLDNGSETSNVSQQHVNSKILASNTTLIDSGLEMRANAHHTMAVPTPQRRPHLSIDSGADLESGKFSAPESRSHSRNNSASIHNVSLTSNLLPQILITDVIPNKGSNNGGTKVSVIGSNFGTNREDFKSVKICGCEVTRSLICVNNSKFTVTTSMWTSGAGFVDIELVDGRKALSKQTFEFVSANQLTDEAKNIKVPSFNSNERGEHNKKKGQMNSLLNSKKKFSASTLGLNTITVEDDSGSNPFADRKKHAPETPSSLSSQKELSLSRSTCENTDSKNKLSPLVASSEAKVNSSSRNSLVRNSSDRYDPSVSFQSKKELEEEISRLRSTVRELTDKNLEMNQYLEELLIKVMSACPEVLQK